MLGAVSGALPFKPETWETVIRRVVPPKTVDVNLEAFRLGAAAAADGQVGNTSWRGGAAAPPRPLSCFLRYLRMPTVWAC